jgi:hypothetical protein
MGDSFGEEREARRPWWMGGSESADASCEGRRKVLRYVESAR